MKVYISGQITGIENTAPFLFERAERYLTLMGNEVVNPMKLPHNHDKSWESYMKEDLEALIGCDAIFILKNWYDSAGAREEIYTAVQIGIKIIYEK